MMYTVTNDFDDIIIQTSSFLLAEFVDTNARGVDRGMFLTVGGDSINPNQKKSIFRRVYTK